MYIPSVPVVTGAIPSIVTMAPDIGLPVAESVTVPVIVVLQPMGLKDAPKQNINRIIDRI